jgi:hypothetical protein
MPLLLIINATYIGATNIEVSKCKLPLCINVDALHMLAMAQLLISRRSCAREAWRNGIIWDV